ncbi:MAG: endolytic transglycosylase MltG [Dysgonamonadaceae bacterium]|jgi:UPF0755 protein|nr:endolytic transglycosylase MltG [Dysgonamonadaceae bacterium]
MIKKRTNRPAVLAGFLPVFLTVFVIFCLVVNYLLFTPVFNIRRDVDIFVDDKTDFPALVTKLESEAGMRYGGVFRCFASVIKLDVNKLRTGRYVLSQSFSLFDVLRIFRNGEQTPVNVTFQGVRLKTDFADRISEQLMFDRDELLEKMNDIEFCSMFELDTSNILTLFIPDTYEMYWNVSAKNFIVKLAHEHRRFWNGERISKAYGIPLLPEEVSVLASIVEEETAVREDYPVIAGLYINRLRRGMPLQADPTVKFAVGDFSLRRILHVHLDVDSPYNTYRHTGLPPGPIRIPSVTAIEAVLNYAHHNYLYMVADSDLSGRTNFASTLKEHNRNAQKYREALNRRGIR